MQRARRPHGIRSRKISVSVSADDLAVLTARAKRFHRGNVSAVVHDLVETLRREEALDALVQTLGADAVTDDELRAVEAEIREARTPSERPRRKGAGRA